MVYVNDGMNGSDYENRLFLFILCAVLISQGKYFITFFFSKWNIIEKHPVPPCIKRFLKSTCKLNLY